MTAAFAAFAAPADPDPDSDADPEDPATPAAVDAFIARWESADGGERANYQLFLTELCVLLGLPLPEPAQADDRDNAYCFERRVIFRDPDGSERSGFIDLYRRACYVLEAKRPGAHALDTPGWDRALPRARAQGVRYARAVPPDEGRPPFVAVADVGRGFALYSEFSRSGGDYLPYPDARSHRIALADLRRPAIRARLRALWLDPLSLDPSRRAARVTRAIAARLAELARGLEGAGQPPETVAAFLIRCLFTLFAEDIGLLPAAAFTNLMISVRETPAQFVPLVGQLWRDMHEGRAFSLVLRGRVPRFNGGLFADTTALPLDRDQLDALIAAGRADWRQVEPAIFGTLLERALDPVERHRLGAHYTPRSYVERLVLPTAIAPLRADWAAVQGAVAQFLSEGQPAAAVRAAADFQARLAQVRVLDPACGSGNFLYVTLEHLKRLEGEVLDTLEALGERQTLLGLAGVSVDPHQLLGLERNPRAAAIAELVLWIGWLQWHGRTHGAVSPPEPILRDFKNIQCRDAVLDAERVEWATDDAGRPVTRWDGRTFKTHPATGEAIPDEAARVPLERYVSPRPADWPEAEFVVGNPPFIGAATMRRALGDGYVEALRGAWPEVPESADYVMYWWERAAALTRAGRLRQFGFIATNSLRQTFNRRVLERHLGAEPPLSLAYAVPDHPWVDTADGAAVRIGMTVGRAGAGSGVLERVAAERPGAGEGLEVELARAAGRIHADLRIGAEVAGAVPLRANRWISAPGVKLHGAGFIVTPDQAAALGLGRIPGLERHIRPYRNGRDLTQTPRGVLVIDLFGLTERDVRNRYPEVYQWVLERVKPERDHNNRATYRDGWWLFGEPRKELRPALATLPRYIATVETAKHRTFVFLEAEVLPDNMLVNIASDDAWILGVLSSRVHVAWALAAGGTLEDRPRYNKTRCFETFPFPDPPAPLKDRIRQLGEALDAHRQARQALHPDLTLTGMYNVLDRLRRLDARASDLPADEAGETPALLPRERIIHEQGLVAILRQLHDELDAAVLEAYGWADLPDPLAPTLSPLAGGEGEYGGAESGSDSSRFRQDEGDRGDEAILERLAALNAARAAEEQRGRIRWLRPAFQQPAGGASGAAQAEVALPAAAPAAGPKRDWPKTLPEQFQALRARLASQGAPASAAELAAAFSRAPRARVAELLDTLVSLGQLRRLEDGRYGSG